jgi:hypothetical protein
MSSEPNQSVECPEALRTQENDTLRTRTVNGIRARNIALIGLSITPHRKSPVLNTAKSLTRLAESPACFAGNTTNQ